MTNIMASVHNINETIISDYSTQATSSNYCLSKWPEVLMAQHSELDYEIESVNLLLATNDCSLIQLDVKLKRLTKAVLTHLELEANFLIPILSTTKASILQKNYLNQGFDALFSTCQATLEYIHSLKLAFGNCLITVKQSERIVYFLDEIKKRLNDENHIYSQITKKGTINGI